MKRYELMFTHLSPNKHEEGRWDIHEYENGCYVKYNDHLAAMKELTNEVRLLTDRLAQVVKERDGLKRDIMHEIEIGAMYCKELDKLKRGKSCDGCEYEWRPDLPGRCPIFCERQKYPDYFKPRDTSAEKGCAE